MPKNGFNDRSITKKKEDERNRKTKYFDEDKPNTQKRNERSFFRF